MLHATEEDRATVKVIDWPFDDRERYHAQLLQYLSQSETLRRIVFLDPDTGLEPTRTPGPQHVLKSEIRDIWGHLRAGDLLVLYLTPNESKRGSLGRRKAIAIR